MEEIIKNFFNNRVLDPKNFYAILENWANAFAPNCKKESIEVVLNSDLLQLVNWEKVLLDLAQNLNITIVYVISPKGQILKSYVNQRGKSSYFKCKK